jgi:DNA-directed RNA polymerase II subunit RPB1
MEFNIKFSILGSTEIERNISKVEITNPINTVEIEENGSLHDSRMGAYRNVKCGTCKESVVKCPGHFGHIKLSEPCFNPNFLNSLLRTTCQSFCFTCYHKDCVCDRGERHDDTGGPRRKRIKITPNVIKIVTPDHIVRRLCGVKVQFQYSRDDVPLTIAQLWAAIRKIPRDQYLQVFPHLTDVEHLADVVFISNLLVLPIASRPPNSMKGELKPDHITMMYIQVLKKNMVLKMKHGIVTPELYEEYHNDLQNSINILFNTENTNKKMRQSIQQNGGIRQRIDGKQGRVRLNLMGKRCEFSARTVLSGDPKLGINEVGIPRRIAENLTVPVLVSRYNIRALNKYKIKYLFKGDGRRYDVSVTNNYRIEIGDTVERCLVDGDIVAVNRQPTLHRGSILACYVRIFDCLTFRLNYSTMVTLNADTDGDEINIHVPQDLESRAELENLMLASTNIVCSQSSKPLVGCTQDSLLGCYLLSKNILSEIDYMDIIYKIGLEEYDGGTFTLVARGHQRRLVPGTRILTDILNHLKVEIKRYEPNEKFLLLDNEVMYGVLDKSLMGAAEDSLVHIIYLKAGHKVAGDFIHLMQKAATAFLDIHGFSVGISDCLIDHEEINFDNLERHLEKSHMASGGRWTYRDEDNLCGALGELTKLAPPHNVGENRLLDMINSGSKGSLLNFNQITRVVGQQTEANGRVDRRFNNGARTLPHYTKWDPGAESRGLVKNSFIKGLSPQEFFFHAMGGRIGILDTVLKTSETGAQYRRMVKTLEPLVVKDVGGGQRVVYNNVNGNVVQFNYGEDGYDGTFLKRMKDPSHRSECGL